MAVEIQVFTLCRDLKYDGVHVPDLYGACLCSFHPAEGGYPWDVTPRFFLQLRKDSRESVLPFEIMLKVVDEDGKTLETPGVLPKSALGEAVGYAVNNWDALKRYLEQGYLAIDNNLSERTLRVIAVGRNNWGVIGSEAGGQTAAVLYSVVGTCKHLGIDPFVYLREALPGLFALGEKPTAEQMMKWLPDRWLLDRQRETAGSQAATG